MFIKKNGRGLIESPVDKRDFTMEHTVGRMSSTELEKAPLETRNREHVAVDNQGEKMSCSSNGWTYYWESLLMKKTGRPVKIDWNDIWELNLEKGTANAKRGDYLVGPPKMGQKNWLPFIFTDEADPKTKYFKVDKYFLVGNTVEEMKDACVNHCGFVTGTSSRRGLTFTFAKFFPFLLKETTSRKNDGHCVWVPDYSKENHRHRGRLIPTLFAFIGRNSWGKSWGWFGDFLVSYDHAENNMFSKYACTIVIKEEPSGNFVEPPAIETPFRDVLPVSWAYEATKWAKENGIAKGYEGGFFKPNQPITRAEVTQILFNYHKKFSKK